MRRLAAISLLSAALAAAALAQEPRLTPRVGDDPPQLDPRTLSPLEAADPANRLRLRAAIEQETANAERVDGNRRQRLMRGRLARQVQLDKQLELREKGDVNRRHQPGAWTGLSPEQSLEIVGPLTEGFGRRKLPLVYNGPAAWPEQCDYPPLEDWLKWCWNFRCHERFDPRPPAYRPVPAEAGPRMRVEETPDWQPLEPIAAGSWVELPPSRWTGTDVQLAAVRFVDPGHVEAREGPRYRVWIRSNGRDRELPPFTLTLLAGTKPQPQPGDSQVSVRVTRLAAGEIRALDMRLPFDALVTACDAEGKPLPIPWIHVLVDSGGEISEAVEVNNGASLPRGEIPPQDPTLFASAPPEPVLGGIATLAGEGLGSAPGAVLLNVNGLEYHMPVLNWSDSGLQVEVTELPLRERSRGEVVLIRRDGTASNPLPVMLEPPRIAREPLDGTRR